MEISQKYKELLCKFSAYDDLLELFDNVILDENRLRELNYLSNKCYPENRDLLGKLRVDLLTVREGMKSR